MGDSAVVIIGAGIVGLMMARSAIERGRHVILIERDTIGAGASTASLNVIHGGLRSLQSLDLAAWKRSRTEQRWFVHHYPIEVRALTCTFPLYRGSVRSPSAMRLAFAIDRAASRLAGLGASGTGGRLLSRDDTLSRWAVPDQGLVGAAEWREWGLRDPTLFLQKLAREVRGAGGVILEHTDATKPIAPAGRITGLRVRSSTDEQELEADTVLVCAGGFARAIAARLDRDIDRISARTTAYNLLLDHPMPTATMLGVSPKPGRGRSFFLREENGLTLAGTDYVARDVDPADSHVSVRPEEIARFRDDLAHAYPPLADASVLAVRSGALPDAGGGSLRERDVIWDHGANGGPAGLFTLSGTKLTTAHGLAETMATRLWGQRIRAEMAA